MTLKMSDSWSLRPALVSAGGNPRAGLQHCWATVRPSAHVAPMLPLTAWHNHDKVISFSGLADKSHCTRVGCCQTVLLHLTAGIVRRGLNNGGNTNGVHAVTAAAPKCIENASKVTATDPDAHRNVRSYRHRWKLCWILTAGASYALVRRIRATSCKGRVGLYDVARIERPATSR